MDRVILKLYLIFLVASLAAGCGTVTPPRTMAPSMAMPGIYHRIQKGQTLWRLSKIYNVDLDELVRVNHISDATNIEVGQLIFIPHAKKARSVPLKYSDDFIWPLKGKVIASFGENHNSMINKGLDIQAPAGSDVVASRSGKVVFYSPDVEGFGKTVVIEHAEGFSTVYTRNSRVLVKPGEEVRQGAVIAKTGAAGRDRGNYLHFEIRKGYAAVNPYFYLP
ncbi:MAG: peptidoglycan DD-metalloendopeptidase family protein [Candidatus Omnitrophota bacterium]